MLNDKILIEQCSPTLSGLKTANLFNVKFLCKDELIKSIKFWNNEFLNIGIKIVLLKERLNSALIYVYREEALKKDFNNPISKKIMEEHGYDTDNIENSINFLKNKLIADDNFPHEIGLFLGYPPKDVEGFICHKGKNCSFCGYWKVYDDLNEALKKFAKYDKCKLIYKKLWQEGRDVMQLTVKKRIVA